MSQEMINFTPSLGPIRESEKLDFKVKFEIECAQDCCEIVKDIVAMANSGGGLILLGVDDTGAVTTPTASFPQFDPAKLSDKIFKYTSETVNFELSETEHKHERVLTIRVHAAPVPIAFTSPGTYTVDGAKQKTAFGQGTVYFRHGAKSETANSTDIRNAFERRLESVRKNWMDNVRRVAEAPADA